MYDSNGMSSVLNVSSIGIVMRRFIMNYNKYEDVHLLTSCIEFPSNWNKQHLKVSQLWEFFWVFWEVSRSWQRDMV